MAPTLSLRTCRWASSQCSTWLRGIHPSSLAAVHPRAVAEHLRWHQSPSFRRADEHRAAEAGREDSHFANAARLLMTRPTGLSARDRKP